MISGILGKKIKQTRIFTEEGYSIPVTLIEAGPCTVLQIKKEEKDGYNAVQLGFGVKKKKRASKPLIGHVRKAGLDKIPCFIREVPIKDTKLVKLGSVIKVGDVFKKGEKINVTGISKGKGFAGVVKRHGFAGGPRTHGQSDRERAPGSIGQTTTPGRVYKGKRMAGRMGGEKVTIKNLEVIEIDEGKNLLTLKGLVPGAKGGFLTLIKTNSPKNT